MTRFTDETLRDTYKHANPCDELCLYLGLDFDDKLNIVPQWQGRMIDAHDINHIHTNPRRDVWSNLISLTRRAHTWFHRNLSAGRMLCILAKLKKRDAIGRPDEFTLAEVELCAGKFIGGIVIDYGFKDPLLARLNADCLARLAALGERT